MTHVRLALAEDFDPLIRLFNESEVSAVAEWPERQSIWQEMLAEPAIDLFVAEYEALIVATATLISAPNLLRGGRRHGFLENVVTDLNYRGRGFGRAVVEAALDRAWQRGCHHVLLQSGRPDPRVRRFYEAVGFQSGIRTGYVAVNSSG